MCQSSSGDTDTKTMTAAQRLVLLLGKRPRSSPDRAVSTATVRRKRTTPRQTFELSAEDAAKFWDGVGVPNVRGCREWQRGKTTAGYGVFWHKPDAGPVKPLYTHRLAYTLSKGEIPTGLVVIHACDNPACVEPSHLSIGSQKDNMRDMAQKGRDWRRYPDDD